MFIHSSSKECISGRPTAPSGYLPKGERRRKANEIVEASGVNDAQQFIEANTGTTFREQAKTFHASIDKS